MNRKKRGLTKKQLRILNRFDLLRELAEEGLVFCEHHNYFPEPEDIREHSCHAGHNCKGYCGSLKIFDPLEGKILSFKKGASEYKRIIENRGLSDISEDIFYKNLKN